MNAAPAAQPVAELYSYNNIQALAMGDQGGDRHAAAYLASLDLLGFDPKARPPKTQAFWDILGTSRAPVDAQLADVLDKLKNPLVLTLAASQNAADGGEGRFGEGLQDRKNRRQIPHRFEHCGYAPVRSDAAPLMAYGRSKASGKPATPRRPARISWPRQASWRLASGGTASSGVGEVSDPALSSPRPSRVSPLRTQKTAQCATERREMQNH